MADVRPTAELLNRIAAALGVPVATFSAPNPPAAADTAPAAHIAALVFDPEGRRFAAAFVELPPHSRKALADIAEICRGCVSAEPPSAINGGL